MPTCFIFSHSLNEEECLSLRLDDEGRVDAPYEMRPIHAVKALQINAQTIIVVPAARSSLYETELPWLGERKAREAIPYALEEELAQNIVTLHFAFDRLHYQNNRYLVAVIDKTFLRSLMVKLDELMLQYDMITLDWFALKENEACVTETGLLIHDNLFKGALSEELASLYLNNKERQSSLVMFKDSKTFLQEGITIQSVKSLSTVWIAERLRLAKAMNLCQGDLQHDKRQYGYKSWYKASLVIASAMLVCMVLMKALYLHFINKKIVSVDKKIAVIYREFFPNASQVISPKFRISQMLQMGATGDENASLWSLLDKLAHAFDGQQMTMEQLRFEGSTLSVTLVSNSFATLERLEERLQQNNVKVSQAQASSHENKVLATLELSLSNNSGRVR